MHSNSWIAEAQLEYSLTLLVAVQFWLYQLREWVLNVSGSVDYSLTVALRAFSGHTLLRILLCLFHFGLR